MNFTEIAFNKLVAEKHSGTPVKATTKVEKAKTAVEKVKSAVKKIVNRKK